MLAKIAGLSTQYFLSDRLSVRIVLNTSGNVIGRQGHLPFGEDFGESGTQEKHHFTSYERDGEISLDYSVNRQCSSSPGRFAQVDRLSGTPYTPQSINRYSYVTNDPITLTDPEGLVIDPSFAQCASISTAQMYNPAFWVYAPFCGAPSGRGGPLLDARGDERGGGGGEPATRRPLRRREEAALQAALSTLTDYLYSRISEDCQKNVVDKLAANLSGGFDIASFQQYLTHGAEFYNGLTSDVLVAGNVMPRQPANILYGGGATVGGVFRSHPGVNAMTSILSPTLTIFIRPGNDGNGIPVVDLSNGGNNPRNLSFLFHEALHGLPERLMKTFRLRCGSHRGVQAT